METQQHQLEHRSIPTVRYQVPRYSGWKLSNISWNTVVFQPSDTKYRDIADGNLGVVIIRFTLQVAVRYQVPRYSGWKHMQGGAPWSPTKVRYQVPRYSGWKPSAAAKRKIPARHVENQVPRYSGYKSIAEREIPSCKAIFSHDD